MRLEGKSAVVTGAGRGIGAEIARLFAGEGAKVFLADNDRRSLEETAGWIKERGGMVFSHPTDVSEKGSMEILAIRACELFGAPDILVNNAGYPMFGYAVDGGDWPMTRLTAWPRAW